MYIYIVFNNFFQKYLLGLVKEEYVDGSVYEGESKSGLRHGKGKLIYNSGSFYDGEWRNGKMDGNGTLFLENGKIVYSGEWRSDRFDGLGVLFNCNPVDLHRPFDYTNLYSVENYWYKYEG